MQTGKAFDVAIVGASIAGAAAAINLSAGGLTVALIDKSTFPRRKSCGEGLSSIGVAELNELGLEKELLQLPKQLLSSYILHYKNDSIEMPIASDSSQMSLGVERQRFDHMLLEAACKRSGVVFFGGSKVKTVSTCKETNEPSRFNFSLSQNTLSHNALSQNSLCAKYLILADGVNSILAERLKVPVLADKRFRYGLTLTLQGESRLLQNKVNIFLFDGYEVFCTPLSERRIGICILAKKQFISLLNEKTQLAELLQKIKTALQFEGEIVEAPLGIGPLGYIKRAAFHHGIFTIGDCSEHLDPIGGMGMAHALLSAKLAAQNITRIERGEISINEAARRYTNEQEKMVRPFRGFTRLSYLSLIEARDNKIVSTLRNSSFGKSLGHAAHSYKQNGISRRFPRMILNAAGL